MRGFIKYATFKGVRMSVPEIVKATGLSPATIHRRIAKGIPLEMPRHSPIPEKLYLEFRGRIATVAEISAETGLTRGQIYMCHDGKTFYDRAPKRPRITLTYDGVTDTARGWAERLGMDQRLILRRRKLGWPVERILRVGLERQAFTVTIGEQTFTIGQLAQRTGLSKAMLYSRIVLNGWPVKRALTEDVVTTSARHAKTRMLKRLIASFGTQSPATPSGPADASAAHASPDAPLPQDPTVSPTGGQSTTFDPLARTGSRPQETHLVGILP